MMPFERAMRFIAKLFYPPKCPLCDALVQARHVPCASCEAGLVRIAGDAFISLPAKCWCMRARSCFSFEGRLKDAVHAYKYSGRLDLADFFAARLAEDLPRMRNLDAIVSVPPDPARLWKRGFDPSALMSKRLSRLVRIRYLPRTLARTRRVEPQVGLARSEREKNVFGAFAVASGACAKIKEARLLVVDDVLTTGATANDCARALMQAGAAEVSALTLARTL